MVPARDTKAPDKASQQSLAQRIPARRVQTPPHESSLGNSPAASQPHEPSTPTRKTTERPQNGPDGYIRPPSCPPNLPDTPRQARPAQPRPVIQVAPIHWQYDPEVTTQTPPPQTPTNEEETFFAQENYIMDTEWSSEDIQCAQTRRVQDLLTDLTREVEMAEMEGCLNQMLDDSKIKEQMLRLSALVPCFTTKTQTDEILASILDVKSLVRTLSPGTNRQDKTSGESYAAKALRSSIHAPGQSLEAPQKNNPNTGACPRTSAKPEALKTTTPMDRSKTAPANPNSAHHPSRMVIQFSPNGIPQDARPSSQQVVTTLNRALECNPKAKHLRIVAANFNYQGNLIVSTRSDQTAAELIQYRENLVLPLGIICNNSRMSLREDKKWYKIQVDGVSTGFSPSENKFGLHSAETVHEELTACNPTYAKLKDNLAANPKWLRTEEELNTTPRSSLVFALSDEEAARALLAQRTLAAFGKHCSLRAFQDRPPVLQCRRCWKFDHPTQKCKDKEKCRICGGPHAETDHADPAPTDCTKCMIASQNGDDTMDIENRSCPHNVRCVNCVGKPNTEHDHPADARRCPVRLAKYGTARENERRATKNNNPWAKTPPQPKVTPPKPSQTKRQPRVTSLNGPDVAEAEPLAPPPAPSRSIQQPNLQTQHA